MNSSRLNAAGRREILRFELDSLTGIFRGEENFYLDIYTVCAVKARVFILFESIIPIF